MPLLKGAPAGSKREEEVVGPVRGSLSKEVTFKVNFKELVRISQEKTIAAKPCVREHAHCFRKQWAFLVQRKEMGLKMALRSGGGVGRSTRGRGPHLRGTELCSHP